MQQLFSRKAAFFCRIRVFPTGEKRGAQARNVRGRPVRNRHTNVYTEMQKKKERKANEKGYRNYLVGSYGVHLLYRMRQQGRQ